jgi:DNA-binding transcriptional ArsR family regulator
VIVNSQDRVFAALASAPRRQAIAFLAQTALSTSDLAQRFGMSAPAVSRHLAVLLEAGLVSTERQGQRVLYRLQRDALLEALAGLASAVDGPLRRASQLPQVPREAL